jgi:hypothetical protein
MNKHRFIIFILVMLAFSAIVTGCSGSNALLDENGEEVVLENAEQPSLVFLFTGTG